MIFSELLTVAKKKNNFEVDATGVTALWPSTTEYKAEVPADKRWFFLFGCVNRNVSSTVFFKVYDAADKQIGQLGSAGAGTGVTMYPSSAAAADNIYLHSPLILDAGEYISVVFGTAQDASSFGSCTVLEIDI